MKRNGPSRLISAALALFLLLVFSSCSLRPAENAISSVALSDVQTSATTAAVTVAPTAAVPATSAPLPEILLPKDLPQTFRGDLHTLADALVLFKPGEYLMRYTDDYKNSMFQPDEIAWDYLHLLDPDGKELTDCILNAAITDFDGDGADELLVLTLRFGVDVAALGYRSFREGVGEYSTRELPQRMNVYGLYMYESAGGICSLAAKMDPLMIDATLTDYSFSYESGGETSVPSGTFQMTCPLPAFKYNINGTCVFFAKSEGRVLIVAESFLSMTEGDGLEYDCSVLAYRNSRFDPLTGAFEIGSAFLGTIATQNISSVIPAYHFRVDWTFSTQYFPAESAHVLFSAMSGDDDNPFAVTREGEEYRLRYQLCDQ